MRAAVGRISNRELKVRAASIPLSEQPNSGRISNRELKDRPRRGSVGETQQLIGRISNRELKETARVPTLWLGLSTAASQIEN